MTAKQKKDNSKLLYQIERVGETEYYMIKFSNSYDLAKFRAQVPSTYIEPKSNNPNYEKEVIRRNKIIGFALKEASYYYSYSCCRSYNDCKCCDYWSKVKIIREDLLKDEQKAKQALIEMLTNGRIIAREKIKDSKESVKK